MLEDRRLAKGRGGRVPKNKIRTLQSPGQSPPAQAVRMPGPLARPYTQNGNDSRALVDGGGPVQCPFADKTEAVRRKRRTQWSGHSTQKRSEQWTPLAPPPRRNGSERVPSIRIVLRQRPVPWGGGGDGPSGRGERGPTGFRFGFSMRVREGLG